MSLESFSYINSLNSANPTTTDNVSEGDDHIRGIKSTLTATFPSITGAVTPTHTELNYVDGVTSAIQTQIDTKLATAGGTLTGNLSLGDNVKAQFGAGNDLSIHHDGPSGNSWIKETGGGDFIIQGSSLHLRDDAGFDFINCNDTGTGGDVTLFHAGDVKLATTSTGIDVTGDLNIGDTTPSITLSDSDATGAPYSRIYQNGALLSIDSDWGNTGASSYTRFTVDSAEAMRINSTGIDVTGSVTCDGLVVDVATANNVANLKSTDSEAYISISDNSTTGEYTNKIGCVGDDIFIQTSNTERLRIDSGGDTIFYNASGTEKMRWDASAERLGIGTGTPSAPLDVETNSTVYAARINQANTTNGDGLYLNIGSTSSTEYVATFRAGGLNVFDIKGNGNVGIGTSSPLDKLDVNGNMYLRGGQVQTPSGVAMTLDSGGTSTRIRTNGSEAMRIDSSGNVGIGTDTPSDYYTNWNNLVVGDGAGDEGITIATGTTSRGTLAFADGTSGDQGYRGFLQYDHLTDNLIVGTSGTTAMTIDSNKNVGIGVVPDAWDSSYTSLDIGTSGSLTSHNSNYTYLSNNGFVDGTSGVWEYKNTDGASLLKMSDNGSMEFNVAPSGTADAAISWTTAMTIDNSGGISKDGSFDGTGSSDDFYWNTGGGDRFRFHSGTTSSRDLLGFSNPNGVVGKIETVGSGTLYNTGNGGGIDFSGNAGTTATGAAVSSGGQVLDDYEEGTWTVTVTTYGGSITVNTASHTCNYTKIGRMISIWGNFSISAISSPTGDFMINGLPFAHNSGYPGDGGGSVAIKNLATAVSGYAQGFITGSPSKLYIRGGYSTTAEDSNMANKFDTGSSVKFQCSYFV